MSKALIAVALLAFVAACAPKTEPAAPAEAPSLIERAVAAQTTEAAPAAAASVAEAKPALAPSAPIELPSTPTESGLIMIETDPSKRADFGTGAPEQAVRLGRKPRPAPVVVEEPLQQVETNK